LPGGFVTVVRARRFVALAGALLALALLCSSASFAAYRTTQPAKKVMVYFVITDKNIAYEILRPTVAGGGDQYLEKYVLRGDFATFFVINRGKKPHGFAFLGKKFAPLKPGRRTHFSRALLVRGAFPYRSTTDPGKAFKGVFRVV
jgi:hypothetical protein